MEKLWSPWRGKYIDSFKSKPEIEECVFCLERDGKIPEADSMKCYQGENAFVMLNLYPYNNGHLMVVPNNHKSSFLDLNKDEAEEINDLLRKAISALDELIRPHGYNMGANLGKAAGAGITSHLHFHLVPRWTGDTNFMPVLGEIKVISQDLIDLRTKLTDEFRKGSA